jgi:phage-related protein
MPGIKFFFESIGHLLQGFGDLFAGTIGAVTKLLQGDLQGAFDAFKQSAHEFTLHLIQAFTNAPRELAQGFIDGIQSQEKAVIATVTNFAENVAKAFRDALGIHSPSSVFAEFGKFTMQGLTMGINANVALPQAAIAGAASGIVSTAYHSTQQQNFYGAQIHPRTLIPTMSEVADQLNTMAGMG